MARPQTRKARPAPDPFRRDLVKILGPGGVLDDPASRAVYARDASHLALGRPRVVALPRTAEDVGRILRLCAEHRVPVVCRGTGTGLSGGAVPAEGQLVLATAGLQECGPVDPFLCRVTVQPGVLNEGVSGLGRPHGLHFAPDPSSQHACTIGGNVAENAGGPHCVGSGVTVQHVLGLRWCDAGGTEWTTGRGLRQERGIGLVNLLCGSEGTLGVVTGADLRLVPDHESLATLLAFFPRLERACTAVVALVGSGLLPAAVEVVDEAMLRAVEQAFGFGFPTDGRTALIVEFAGSAREVHEDASLAAELLDRMGAGEVRRARDEQERLALWRCRKKAFGAVGRLAPSYVSMDVVVPLAQLPAMVLDIGAVQAEHGVGIATVLHAGDGNLHPGIHYDDRDPRQKEQADLAADAIVRRALARGGSVTGEHGVGIEKRHALPWMLDAQTARLHHAVKDLLDPCGLLNPGKLLPDPRADFAAMKPVPQVAQFQWDSLTVTAPAAVPWADLQAAAMQRGLWIPVGAWAPRAVGGWGLATAGTVGDAVSDLVTGPTVGATGTVRDTLLELWARTGDGRPFHTGAPVFKNVAGFDLAGALCGSGRTLIVPTAATFLLRPLPRRLGIWVLEPAAEPALLPGALEGLLALLARLARRSGGRLEPVCLIDGDGHQRTGPVVVLVPGRPRAWDLEAVPAHLALPGISDFLTVTGQTQVPFPEALNALQEQGWLPGWAQAGLHWTMLARRSGAIGPQGRILPQGLTRLIWQGSGTVCWSPQGPAADASWWSDTVCRDGRPTRLPVPAAGVPLHVMRGLKGIFDPDRVLENPDWLTGPEDSDPLDPPGEVGHV